jgi:hypothetical protein
MSASFVAKGAWGAGTTSFSPGIPAGMAAGDFMVLDVHTCNQAVTTPSGWTPFTGTPISTGTAGAAGGTRLTQFYRWWQSGDTAPTVSVSGGTVSNGIISGYRGIDQTTPFDLNPVSTTLATANTTLTMTGLTTVTDGAMIHIAAARDVDANSTTGVSAFTNANLTGLTEIHDQTVNTAVGGGIFNAYGIKDTAGAIGNTTITQSSSIAVGTVTALRPALGTTYSDSTTEDLTAADTKDAEASFETARSESATAGNTQTGILFFTGDVTEALTLSDTTDATVVHSVMAYVSWLRLEVPESTGTVYDVSASANASALDTNTAAGTLPVANDATSSAGDTNAAASSFPADRSESSSAAESNTASAARPADNAESAAAADTESVVATMLGAASEPATGAESSSVVTTFVSASTEAGSAAESGSVIAAFPVAGTASASASDAGTGSALYPDSGTAVASASDTTSGQSLIPASDTESVTSADAQSVLATFVSATTEAASATESSAGVAGTAFVDITESAFAATSGTAAAVFVSSNSEPGTANDTQTVITQFVAAMNEAAAAGHAQSVLAVAVSAATETLSAQDAKDATILFLSAGTAAATATDASSGAFIYLSSTNEAASSADLIDSIKLMVGAVVESGLADTTQVNGGVLNVSAEGVAVALDVVTGYNVHLGSTTDQIYKILANKQELDPVAGKYRIYDDDGVTVLWEAGAWEDVDATIPYSGKRLRRIDKLVTPWQ